MKNLEKIKFIDLFSGIGGFHQALNEYDSECVFASEIDKYAIETYTENYGINSDNDITMVKPVDLKDYNLLCAGFPCQAFSKAGKQEGFNDETKGTLFFHIERLLRYRFEHNKPVKYIILENVANLVSHDDGNTWNTIKRHLKSLDYIITENPIILSPHQFGIPQLRSRVFILGVHKSYIIDNTIKEINIDKNHLPHINKKHLTSIYDIIDEIYNNDKSLKLSDLELKVINMWDEFYKALKEKTIGFPVWAEYFKTNAENYDDLPLWKRNFIKKNIELYQNNKKEIDKWLEKYDHLEGLQNSHKKFEWQAGNQIESVFDGIIQFRPSGVRVKRPSEIPALVAMVHIPIIGKYKRRLSVREVARLQNFPDSFKINKNVRQAYKQFGNSVNVRVVQFVLDELFAIRTKV